MKSHPHPRSVELCGVDDAICARVPFPVSFWPPKWGYNEFRRQRERREFRRTLKLSNCIRLGAAREKESRVFTTRQTLTHTHLHFEMNDVPNRVGES